MASVPDPPDPSRRRRVARRPEDRQPGQDDELPAGADRSDCGSTRAAGRSRSGIASAPPRRPRGSALIGRVAAEDRIRTAILESRRGRGKDGSMGGTPDLWRIREWFCCRRVGSAPPRGGRPTESPGGGSGGPRLVAPRLDPPDTDPVTVANALGTDHEVRSGGSAALAADQARQEIEVPQGQRRQQGTRRGGEGRPRHRRGARPATRAVEARRIDHLAHDRRSAAHIVAVTAIDRRDGVRPDGQGRRGEGRRGDAVGGAQCAGAQRVEPSKNCTVPVGEVAPAVLTVAVKVTDWPETDGSAEEARAVVVGAWFRKRADGEVTVGSSRRQSRRDDLSIGLEGHIPRECTARQGSRGRRRSCRRSGRGCHPLHSARRATSRSRSCSHDADADGLSIRLDGTAPETTANGARDDDDARRGTIGIEGGVEAAVDVEARDRSRSCP